MAKSKWEEAPVVNEGKNRWESAPPFAADATATQAFNPVKEKPVSLAEILGTVGRSQTPSGMAINMATPQRTAQVAGTTAEMGLPLLGTGVTYMPLRILATSLLQGTGSMLGRGITDVAGATRPNIPEALGQAGESALISGALQTVGELPIATFNKLRAPFVGQFDQSTARVAQKYGVDLPASSLTRSGFVKATEALGAKGAFGGSLVNRVENAGAKLNQIGDEMVSRIGRVKSPAELGQSLSEGFNNYEKIFKQTKSELYDSAILKPGDVAFTPSKTLPVLDDMIKNMENVVGKKPAILTELKAIRKGLGGDVEAMADGLRKQGFNEVSIKKIIEQNPQVVNPDVDALTIKNTVHKLQNRINFKNPDTVVGGYEGDIRRLTKVMRDDLDDAIKTARPELAEAIDKANKYYAEGINKLNSNWGKKINAFVQQNKLSELPDAILSKGTPAEWVPNIYETIGQEATESLKAHTLEKIIKNSKGEDGFFQANGLRGQINSYGTDKLNAIFGVDATKQLSELAQLSTAFKTGQMIAEGSQTAYVARVLGILYKLSSAPLGALKFAISDKLFTDFVTSQMGQKLLTEGYKTIPKGLQLGMGTTARMGGTPLAKELLSQPTDEPRP